MAKEKVTITVERDKLAEARALVEAPTNSGTIDVALTRLIAGERLRRDIAAYRAVPPTDEEVALAMTDSGWDDLADDTDWEAAFRTDR